jgi:protein-disulfide isomerase
MSLPSSPYADPARGPRPKSGRGTVVAVALSVIALGLSSASLIIGLTGDGAAAPAATAPAAAPSVVTQTVTAPAAAATTAPVDYTGAVAATGVAVGPAGEALTELPTGPEVRIDVYTDYMCPYCQQFELAYGAQLLELVGAGRINLVIHNLSILDQFSSGTQYSTRAAAAALTVATEDPAHYYAFNTALFAEGTQPEENTTGLTDAELGDVATAAGVSEEVAAKIAAGNLTDAQTEGATLTTASTSGGVTGTPTALVTQGDAAPEAWNLNNLGELLSQLG